MVLDRVARGIPDDVIEADRHGASEVDGPCCRLGRQGLGIGDGRVTAGLAGQAKRSAEPGNSPSGNDNCLDATGLRPMSCQELKFFSSSSPSWAASAWRSPTPSAFQNWSPKVLTSDRLSRARARRVARRRSSQGWRTQIAARAAGSLRRNRAPPAGAQEDCVRQRCPQRRPIMNSRKMFGRRAVTEAAPGTRPAPKLRRPISPVRGGRHRETRPPPGSQASLLPGSQRRSNRWDMPGKFSSASCGRSTYRPGTACGGR